MLSTIISSKNVISQENRFNQEVILYVVWNFFFFFLNNLCIFFVGFYFKIYIINIYVNICEYY